MIGIVFPSHAST